MDAKKKVPFYVIPNSFLGNVTLAFREIVLTSETSREDFLLPLRDSSGQFINRLSTIGRAIVETLAKVHGIKKIEVQRHDCELDFSGAYRWRGDLGPRVRAAIESVLASHDMQAVECHRRKPKAKTPRPTLSVATAPVAPPAEVLPAPTTEIKKEKITVTAATIIAGAMV